MEDKVQMEFHEGKNAFQRGDHDNPYPHDGENWWRNEVWERGHEQAKKEAEDDWDDWG